MNSLVSLTEDRLVTTSKIIADGMEKSHHSVLLLIRRYKDELSKLGNLEFRIRNSEGAGRPMEYCLLTEEQTMFLITLMRNNEKVISFKLQLTQGFIKLRNIVNQGKIKRLAGKETRKTLTDKLKESNEVDRMHGHAYGTYTRLAYTLCGITKTKDKNFRDSLSPDDLDRVKLVESMMGNLLEMGKEYGEIKDILKPIFERKVNDGEIDTV